MNSVERLQRRLIKAIEITGSGCWEWQKHRDRYGILNVDGKVVKAHRMSWYAFNGPIPDGMCVLHKCDNPPCINPAHLFLGTQADNVRDCRDKGRLVPPKCPPEKLARGDANGMRKHSGLLSGEKNGRSKLTDSQRREIALRKTNGERTKDLAAEFGVDASQVNRAVRYCRQNHAQLF